MPLRQKDIAIEFRQLKEAGFLREWWTKTNVTIVCKCDEWSLTRSRDSRRAAIRDRREACEHATGRSALSPECKHAAEARHHAFPELRPPT